MHVCGPRARPDDQGRPPPGRRCGVPADRGAARLADDKIETTLNRLRFEHCEDECFAEELTEALNALGTGNPDVNIEAIGYMLRGFFEAMRRHIAFESEMLLPIDTSLSAGACPGSGTLQHPAIAADAGRREPGGRSTDRLGVYARTSRTLNRCR
jgi:hypothetical protein